MQKRGVVVDADDFAAIRDTYPEHPSTKIVPNVRTMEELKAKRRSSNRQKIDQFDQTFEAKRMKYQGAGTEKPYILSEFSKGNNPRFTSVNQRKEFDR